MTRLEETLARLNERAYDDPRLLADILLLRDAFAHGDSYPQAVRDAARLVPSP
jgi:hypothetical protein